MLCRQRLYFREYHNLKEEDLTLIFHDFNESQRGKDQCDRETAVAQHCRTVYLNASHDTQTAQGVKNIFLFMRGAKNSKVSVIQIDSNSYTNSFRNQEGKFHGALLAPLAVSLVQPVASSAVKDISVRGVRRA